MIYVLGSQRWCDWCVVCGVVYEEEDINTKVRLDKRMKLN